MPTSKAQQKATAKYVKANYDRVEAKVPKAARRDTSPRGEAGREPERVCGAGDR